MIDDFKPASQPAKSSPAALNELPETKSEEDKDETFRTPEEIAATQTLQAPAAQTGADPETAAIPQSTAPAPKGGWRQKLALSWPPGKKEYILFAALLVLVGGSLAAWHFTHESAQPVVAAPKLSVIKKAAPPPSNTVASTLTGLPVDPSINKLPVTGVMIENSDFARPQAGLSQAGVVFEAIAEAGITRFLALYQDSAPTNVGPIRSARPYYVQWALGFDAAYAHVGGSPEALADIKAWNVKDLNQFYNGGSYHRIASRQAPHNVYTGIPTLNQLETKKGYTSSTYSGFLRKKDQPAKKPTAATVKLTLSGPDFNTAYYYNAKTNSYERNEAGAPHIDANTNTQINPKVVVAMVMHYSLEADHYHSDYGVIGSGPVYVFQDGTMTTGQWAKTSNTSQITFTNASGTPIKLNAGQTWLTAIAGTNDVSYSP
jgi:hypothetical protein